MSTGQRMGVRFKRALSHMTPAHIIRNRVTKSTMMKFADKIGLVYFGYVDQRDDEHRLVRGHTVSATHEDNHYCVGSVKGYDVMMVLRNDTMDGRHVRDQQQYHWLIVTIDLHTSETLPHFYIGHHNRDQAFMASYEQLSPLMLGSLHQYSHQFLSYYAIYAKAMHAVEIERIITPQVSEVIATHFDEASIEIEDNTIFLYIDSPRPSEGVLEKLLSNGLWLAESIDMANEAA